MARDVGDSLSAPTMLSPAGPRGDVGAGEEPMLSTPSGLPQSWFDRWEVVRRWQPGVEVAWVLAALFGALFGWLAVRQHSAFGTYSFDLAIYDQGFWLASRGKSFITVRGLNFWGHHVNLISLAYIPFYWFGAGARFIVATQAVTLGIGAVPVFLLARYRFSSGWYGLILALCYLLYAPVEWLAQVNFHPEALCVTPLLFSWWFLIQRRWRAFAIAAVVALSTREDVALVFVVMGLVIWWMAAKDYRSAGTGRPTEFRPTMVRRSDVATRTNDAGTNDAGTNTVGSADTPPVHVDGDNSVAIVDGTIVDGADVNDAGTDGAADPPAEQVDATASEGIGGEGTSDSSSNVPTARAQYVSIRNIGLIVMFGAAVYYLLATNVILPAFNRGNEPFYIRAFYGEFGSSGTEVGLNVLRRPDRVIALAAQPDHLRFYRDLILPWGGLPLAGLPQLLMAGPQLLASTLSNVPYPRSIRYQYTSAMVAPISIAAIEGAAWITRRRLTRMAVVAWLVICMWTSNTAWSPAPWAEGYGSWGKPSERSEVLAKAVAVVPGDASVTANYRMVPHLAHRTEIYDWPNPFQEANWGIDDQYRFPDPATVEYVAIEVDLFGDNDRAIYEEQIAPNFELVFNEGPVQVLRRKTDGG